MLRRSLLTIALAAGAAGLWLTAGAVAQFNSSAKECHDLGDHGTAAVFEEMVRDEEKHADWFEGQLDAIERVGLPQYLAQQIDSGQGPE